MWKEGGREEGRVPEQEFSPNFIEGTVKPRQGEMTKIT
jgi:hypothetical protein